jgi:hypothetical protein
MMMIDIFVNDNVMLIYSCYLMFPSVRFVYTIGV